MNIAVIPARAGSKRIPNKNIKDFMGKPIIAYSIDCAVASGLFDRVIVSTDDERIADISIELGAEVPFKRPETIADDMSGIDAVLSHATEQLLKEHSDIDAICCIFATTPFIQKEDIEKGLKLLNEDDWSFVFSATEYSFPVYRSIFLDNQQRVEMIFPEMFTKRSQDLKPSYHDAAQFYWGKPLAWLNKDVIFCKNSTIVKIPRWRVCDIDTPEDWQQAELLYKAMNG